MALVACRLLPFAVAGGPHNMAADELLLEAAEGGMASLRLYGWTTATLSLGYFQREQLRLSDPLLAPLPFVRRPSGGDTLVHHYEVTYAIGLPASLARPSRQPWLCRMHEIIAEALGELGVAARLFHPGAATPLHTCDTNSHPPEAPARVKDTRVPRRGSGPAKAGALPGPLCFRHFTPGDLLIGAAKVVGSAQRRRRGALMQHGGILLAGSPHTPSLPGIRELTGHDLKVDAVCAAVADGFARRTGWSLTPGDWSAAEHRRLEGLVAGKYSLDAWNRKR
jgi:lipoate-protein ligase A